MRRVLTGALAVLLLMPALRAQDRDKDKAKDDKSSGISQDFKDLQKELEKYAEKAQSAFQKAETNAEKDKIRKDFQKKMAGFADRFLALALKEPDAPEAPQALVFVLQAAPKSTSAEKAAGQLLKGKTPASQLVQFGRGLAKLNAPAGEKLLKGVLDKSKNEEVLAQANLGLGEYYKAQGDESGAKLDRAAKLYKQAEEYLTKVTKKYADVEEAAADAKRNLEDIRRFGVGKQAMEIEGEDADGKKFKLSDYKGKVVVLDFWARW